MQQLLASKKRTLTKLVVFCLMACAGLVGYAQHTVSGRVTDTSGDPLIGASVIQQGQSRGVATDINGLYSISVPANSSLVVSYVGYDTQVVPVDGRSTINIELKENSTILDDVVVVGYGTMTRKDVTSSISTVKAEDLNIGTYTDPAQLLQGKVPGLTVVQSSDPNGGTASVTLRGASTLNGATEPLYVIDGIAGVDLSLVSPNDIESIDVLRDAAATAIYGSKASNGVIMITTKKGAEGRTNVTYNGYVSWERLIKKLEMLSGPELRQYAAEQGLTIPNDLGYDTDWVDEVTRTGFAHNHNLSISGGNKTTTFTSSITYMERDGIIKTTNMNRLTARNMVTTTTLKDHLTFSIGLNGSVSNHEMWALSSKGGGYNDGSSPLDGMYYYSPLVPVYNEDGSYYTDPGQTQNYNPVAAINQNRSKNTYKRLQALGKVSIKIIDGLLVNGNFSYQNSQLNSKSYYSVDSEIFLDNGKASRNTWESIMKSMELYANFDHTFNEIHKISLMAGYSWEQQENKDGFGAETYNFYDDQTGWNNLGLGNSFDTDDIWSNTKSTLRMISFYARANYSFNSKYIVQAAVRRDGSSAFGSNNEWATFPSASVAWRINEEKFLKDTGIFNDLKIRVGWGKTGNSAGFDAYTAKMYYGATGWFTYNGNNYRTIGALRNSNPDLKWETTETWNFGLDFAFFNSRLNGTIEYYTKKTTDMIFDYNVSTDRYAYGTMTANVGEMNNKGIEISINAVPVQTRDWNWSTNLNLSHNKNELTRLSNDKYSVNYVNEWEPNVRNQTNAYLQRLMEGEPVGTFYLYEWAGIDADGNSLFYKHDPETGARTGETTTAPTDTDRTICGNAQPKLTMGWNNDIRWKNWNLNAFFTGVFGNKIYNETATQYSGMFVVAEGKNVLKSSAEVFSAGDVMSNATSDYFLENGSYFRLSSLTLGYTLRNCFNGWLKSINLHATCNNVFTITSYSGIDPEINLGGLYPGIDSRRTQYPRTRSFLFGATIQF